MNYIFGFICGFVVAMVLLLIIKHIGKKIEVEGGRNYGKNKK